MVVAWIRLRQMRKLKTNKTKKSTYLIRTVNCSCSKVLVIIKVMKMILIKTALVIMIMIIV